MIVRILLLAATAAAGILCLALLRTEEQSAVRTILRADAAVALLIVGLDAITLCGGGDPLGHLRSAVLSVAGAVLL